MEFPDLGKHCDLPECKQLDFLPFRCEGCKLTFCLEHRGSAEHRCKNPRHDVQVNTCPLCNKAVVVGRGENVDQKMSEHIEKGCVTEEEERRRKNKCSFARCKNVELIPFRCSKCQKTFCVKHRADLDHQCEALNRTRRPPARTIGPFIVPQPKPKTVTVKS